MATQPYPQLKFSADRRKVLCELEGDYRVATPEELVRQEYIHHLRDHYGSATEDLPGFGNLAGLDTERP